MMKKGCLVAIFIVAGIIIIPMIIGSIYENHKEAELLSEDNAKVTTPVAVETDKSTDTTSIEDDGNYGKFSGDTGDADTENKSATNNEQDEEPEQIAASNEKSAYDEMLEKGKTDFAEIYKEKERNEMAANKKYDGTEHYVYAEINKFNGKDDSTLAKLGLYGYDGIDVAFTFDVDNTKVFFHTAFKEEEEDKLMELSVGDYVLFKGTFEEGTFIDCILIEE
jgi:hypothetical protein